MCFKLYRFTWEIWKLCLCGVTLAWSSMSMFNGCLLGAGRGYVFVFVTQGRCLKTACYSLSGHRDRRGHMSRCEAGRFTKRQTSTGTERKVAGVRWAPLPWRCVRSLQRSQSMKGWSVPRGGSLLAPYLHLVATWCRTASHYCFFYLVSRILAFCTFKCFFCLNIYPVYWVWIKTL